VNVWVIIIGYLGCCCAEYFVMRSAIVGGSGSALFMVRRKQYWLVFLLLIAPCSGLLAGFTLLDDQAALWPIAFDVTRGLGVKAFVFGAAFGKIVGGGKFADSDKMEVNDLRGVEREFRPSDALRWYFAR
jgi:hypothetical protein